MVGTPPRPTHLLDLEAWHHGSSAAYSHVVRKVPKITSLRRALLLLEGVLEDGGQSSLASIARRAQIPVATAHRQAATLIEAGYLLSPSHGCYLAGPRLAKIANAIDQKQLIATVAEPILDEFAAATGLIVQLGTLENEMVTYRVKTGRRSEGLFTRVGMQLEAYCSGIGKILLAYLDLHERATYLAGGPFPALTERTITDPRNLAEELDQVRIDGYAIDDGEIDDALFCVAVPIRIPDGRVLAAISISRERYNTADNELISSNLEALRETASQIEQRLA